MNVGNHEPFGALWDACMLSASWVQVETHTRNVGCDLYYTHGNHKLVTLLQNLLDGYYCSHNSPSLYNTVKINIETRKDTKIFIVAHKTKQRTVMHAMQ